jgi:hypothetical protein
VEIKNVPIFFRDIFIATDSRNKETKEAQAIRFDSSRVFCDFFLLYNLFRLKLQQKSYLYKLKY